MLVFYAIFLFVMTIALWYFVRNRIINIFFGLLNIYGGITGVFFQRIAGRNQSILFEGKDAVIMGSISFISGIIILINAFRKRKEKI